MVAVASPRARSFLAIHLNPDFGAWRFLAQIDVHQSVDFLQFCFNRFGKIDIFL